MLRFITSFEHPGLAGQSNSNLIHWVFLNIVVVHFEWLYVATSLKSSVSNFTSAVFIFKSMLATEFKALAIMKVR